MEKYPEGKKKQNGIYVALEPVRIKKIIAYYNIHLLNDTLIHITFNYNFSLKKQLPFTFKNELSPGSAFFLNSIDFEWLNDVPLLEFIISFDVSEEFHEFHKRLKIKPKDLSKKLKYIPLINAKGYIYQLHIIKDIEIKPEADIQEMDLKSLKEMMLESNSKSNEFSIRHMTGKSYMVIDLHIEKLISDYQSLANTEIVLIQLSHFQKQLDKAFSEGLSKVYVIHGIGKGKLKNEIFRILEDYPGIASYNNSYDKRFGFGATEIIFK